MWESLEDAGNVNVDYFKYHKGCGDSSGKCEKYSSTKL